MINVYEEYQDVLDRINENENGQLTIDRFNRWLWIAQLNTLDWLSGDINAKQPPEPYVTEKDRDWLTPFIVPYSAQIKNGIITKPADYYLKDNLYTLGGTSGNINIELLNGNEFTYRSQTYIEGLQPSYKKPISKLVGNQFQFNPTDLGSITLEYIRYPVKAYLAMMVDETTHDIVYDSNNSIDLEWGEYARSVLTYYVADQYFNFTREQSGKQFNQSTGKLEREGK